MAPTTRPSKAQDSKPQGKDIRGFFAGDQNQSAPLGSGSARTRAIVISDDEDSSAPSSSNSAPIKGKHKRVMEEEEGIMPVAKSLLKRKKLTALISSDEEGERRPSPPRKKATTSSHTNGSNAKDTRITKNSASKKAKFSDLKKQDGDFVPSESVKGVDCTDADDKPGKLPAKTTSKTESSDSLNASTKAGGSRTIAKGVNANNAIGATTKSKFNWAAKVAKAAGPSAPGSKEVPRPKDPNCLAGLSFVFTGELSAFSRDEAIDLAKRFGGRVVVQPSSRTDYVVLGADAGPSKLAAIKKHNLMTLDEDSFLDLIATRVPDIGDARTKKKIEKEQEAIKQAAREMETREKMAGKEQAGTGSTSVPFNSQLWTDRYAPRTLKEVCGNKGQVEKLQLWLHDWSSSFKSGFKKPGKNAMNTCRAVLITGPPGVGKTTSAHLCAKLEGFTPIELNASDARSKKLIENSANISNTSLDGWMSGGHMANAAGVTITDKTCLIMDEVDGMSAGDRGGIGALIALIKKTKIPIICIANDKGSQKLRPLIANTFNLTFKRPEANVIRSRLLTIAYKEKMKIPANVIDQLVAGSQSDIRQVLNMLSTWKLSSDTMDFDEGKSLAKMNEKYSVMTPFDVTYRMLGPYLFSATARETLNDKIELYFHDPSFMPLFMQENYLKTQPAKIRNDVGPEKTLKLLDLMDKAASSVSDGDVVDALIHGPEQHWALMPLHAVCSTVRPASFLYGTGGGYGSPNPICFPAWLGQNSKQSKLNRQLTDIQARMRLKVSADKLELRQSYLPSLYPYIVRPLLDRGTGAIDEVIDKMDDYFLNREDWDTIVELGVDEHRDDTVLRKISAATKTAFTKKYNANEHPIAFHKAVELGKAPKKIAAAGPAPDLEEAFDIDEDIPDEIEEKSLEDDSDINHDSLIKAPGRAHVKTTGKATAPGKRRGKVNAKN